jgi:hypothetical protein
MALEHQSSCFYLFCFIQCIALFFNSVFKLKLTRFPAEIWGRQRSYWRAHLDVNFEKVLEVAREQLIKR